ncbi:Serine proteinase inhibitor 1 [Thelohanellus kitauei]|uniref:Serine proteinase inhibitor 1 n=1 Tax=Thelohanellus kitauei TaxID=669202 RepID=A0A0C2IUH9_THEKT|nr:Serine proteinase inhibitor 1 [Thelohanellus kitauei]
MIASPEGINTFTSTVLSQIYNSQDTPGNLALSGLCFFTLIATVNLGLDGRSFDQLTQFLGDIFDKDDRDTWKTSESAYKLFDLVSLFIESTNMNSALFYSFDLFNEFQYMSYLIYRLNKIKVDASNRSEAVRKMNDWVYDQTYGWIRHMFEESMLADNKAIFVTALSFTAEWRRNFDDTLTQTEIFYDDNGQPIEVSMMNQQSNIPIYDSPDDDFQLLFKPFERESLFSVIVLPSKGRTIEDALKNLKLDLMPMYFKNSSMKFVDLKMPKFEILSQNDLVNTLIHFGVTDIFDPLHSDFGCATNQTVYIGNLIQVVNLDVDELGVNAEKDDEATFEEPYTQPYKFYVTKPFVFLVYLSSENLVLYGAIVTNPNSD